MRFFLYMVGMIFVNVALIIKYINIPVYFGEKWTFVGIPPETYCSNFIAITAFLLLLQGLIGLYILKYSMKNASVSLPSNKKLEYVDESFNISGVFMTLLALLLLDFNGLRGVLLFGFLYIVVSIIMMRNPHMLLSPVLSVFNYKVYRLQADYLKVSSGSCFIFKGDLSEAKNIKYTCITDKIYCFYG